MNDGTIEFGNPETIIDGSTYGYEWTRGDQPSVRIQIEDVHSDGDKIVGGFTVWWLLDQPLGVRAIQPFTMLNLASSHSSGWRSIPRELGKRMPNVDWEGAMTIAVGDTLDHFRAGDPTIGLGTVEAKRETPFILEPWISGSGATVLYGEGGLSKSLIALAMALSVSTGVPVFGKEPTTVGPVMYFDYEDDYTTHVNRLVAMCRALGIPQHEANIHYHALTSKVSQAKREMTKRAREVGAVLGILDSVGMGRGGSAVAAEDTIRMFRGLREIGIPFLAIDHVSKAAKDKDGGEVDAYGSIYTMNSARLAWSLIRQHSVGGSINIHATNRKANHVRRAPPQTIEITYRNDERGVPEFIDIVTSNEFGLLMESVGTHERLMMWLGSHREWRSYEQLADELGIKETTMRKVVSRDLQNKVPTFETKKELRKTWVRTVTRSVTKDVSHDVTQDVTEESEEEE